MDRCFPDDILTFAPGQRQRRFIAVAVSVGPAILGPITPGMRPRNKTENQKEEIQFVHVDLEYQSAFCTQPKPSFSNAERGTGNAEYLKQVLKVGRGSRRA